MDLNEPPAQASHRLTPATVDAQSTEPALIEALRAGQLDALKILYQRYGRLVFALAQRILKNSEEAEEVTQDVFVTLWEKIDWENGGFSPERGSLRGYLTLMARSRAIDRLRAHTAHHQRLYKWHVRTQAIAATPPLEMASLQERGQDVREALMTLSEKERQVLEIAYYDGLSQSEIAQKLDIPLGTVKTRSRRALKKLRHALKNFS